MTYGKIYKNSKGVIIEKSFETMFHYTDINALPSILRNDEIVLWATNCLYLNDSQEINEGISVIERTLKKKLHQGSFRNYYVTSFSGNGDEMSMWRMYASDGHGCALGFNPKLIYLPSSGIYDFCTVCLYGEDELSDLEDEYKIINSSRLFYTFENGRNTTCNPSQATDNFLVETCVSIKNPAFKIEQEVRGVKYHSDLDNVKTRVKNGVIIPYIEVKIPKEALTEIVIGPTNNSDLSTLSIIHHLQRCGYKKENVKIINSKVPYRG